MKQKIIAITIVILIITLIITLGYKGYKALTVDKITCSNDPDSNGVAVEQKYVIQYSKNNVTTVAITRKFIYENTKSFASFKAVVVPGTNSMYEKMENENIQYSSKTNDSSFSYTLTVNVKKINKAEMTTLGLNENLTALKKSLEDEGLTCK